jgi:Ca2+/H+ antiporter, TMEM165/GDT1 family
MTRNFLIFIACAVTASNAAPIAAREAITISDAKPAQDVVNSKIINKEDNLDHAHNAVQSDHVFTILDTDHDELLSRDEFRSYYQHQSDYGDGHAMEMEQIVHDTTAEALGFWSGFLNSVAMIIVTELGDKTFFIAALLAMRYSPAAVFTGAWAALIIMTILSTAIGFALPQLLPRKYTGILAAGLFAFFGYKLLHEAYEMYTEGKGKSSDVSDELAEAEEELKAKGLDVKPGLLPTNDPESGTASKTKTETEIAMTILWQSLTMTFFAEWGDRSQIATIAMASHQNPFGVTLGGCIGHGLCTGLACVGGRFLAARISERMVLLAGGSLFVIFAIHALVTDAL